MVSGGPSSTPSETEMTAPADDGPSRHLLVPISESNTLRQTIGFTSDQARAAASGGDPVELHIVHPVAWQRRGVVDGVGEAEQELLERAQIWVREDLELDAADAPPVEVTTAVIGDEEVLFSPTDYAEVIIDYARQHHLDHVILDPGYRPGVRTPLLTPLEAEFDLTTELSYEVAPVSRPIGRRSQLIQRTAGGREYWLTFAIAYGFYLAIGGFAGALNLVTGFISALIVATVLGRTVFEYRPAFWSGVFTTARWLIYLPFLMWEIVKANLHVVYIIFHPRLPIEPRIVELQPALWHGLPVTTLANSITLTPGTLTIDVRRRRFYVHCLTKSSREGLLSGTLERAVRFVFYGLEYARLHTPEYTPSEGEPD